MKRLHPILLLLLLGAGVLPAAARPLTLDKARSHVEIAVKATVDSFAGSLDDYTAALQVDEATGRITQARFDFKFAEVRTGKARRDRQMHEWQDTPRHPDGSFVLRSLEPAADGRWEARGSLQLHGVIREVVMPVTVTSDRHLLAVDGEAVLDTRDFGLPVIRMLGLLKVDPRVTVRFHLQGTLAGE